MNFEKSVSVDYAFCNDGRNLCVLFMFKDPKFLSSIDATGITIYANTSGKKDKDSGIRFLKKVLTAEELIAWMESQGTTLPEEKKRGREGKGMRYTLFEADVIN